MPDVALLRAGKKIGLARSSRAALGGVKLSVDDAELFEMLRVAEAASAATLVSAEH